MGRSGVRSNTTKHALYASQAERAGLEYVIVRRDSGRRSQRVADKVSFSLTQGETNSFSLHGVPGVSDSAEAAIWLADYALQAATLNVKEVDFHGGVGFA